MKQTKKLTRAQREFLQKKGKDIEGVRVVEETKESLVYIDKTGAKHTIMK